MLNKYFTMYSIPKNDTRIWTSSYERARRTAEFISKQMNLREDQTREDDMLVELDFGLFDGLTKEQIQEQYTLEWVRFKKVRQEKENFMPEDLTEKVV